MTARTALAVAGVVGAGVAATAARGQPAEPPPIEWSAAVEGFATVGTLDRVIGGARGSLAAPASGPVRLVLRPSVFLGRVDGRTSERELRVDGLAYAFPDGAPHTPGLYGFALALYQESRLRRQDHRLTAGAGVGWRAVGTEAGALTLSAAPVAEWTAYEARPDLPDVPDRRRGRLSLRAEGRVRLSAALALSAETFLKPALSDPGDLVWLSTAALDAAVAPRLSLRLGVDDVYESRVPDGVETRDLRLAVGLRLRSP